MSGLTYHLAWLAAALVLAAAASGAITRHLRQRISRRARAARLLEALAAYSAWVASQRRSTFFQGDTQGDQSPLEEMRELGRQWFPQISDEAAQLLGVHGLLIDFLWTQQMLRLKDAEAWLEADHDARFMALWRLHRQAVQAVHEKLVVLGAIPELEREAASAFPASAS